MERTDYRKFKRWNFVKKRSRWRKSYKLYLTSTEWQIRRLTAIIEAGACCSNCQRTEELAVHHLSYERIGHEEAEDLRVLCKTCHESWHNLHGCPPISEHSKLLLRQLLHGYHWTESPETAALTLFGSQR